MTAWLYFLSALLWAINGFLWQYLARNPTMATISIALAIVMASITLVRSVEET